MMQLSNLTAIGHFATYLNQHKIGVTIIMIIGCIEFARYAMAGFTCNECECCVTGQLVPSAVSHSWCELLSLPVGQFKT